MTIVLLGYMGSGKTYIGRKLAEVLSYEFLDLDDYIVSKESDSISTIFQNKGEIYFRKIEANYLRELLNNNIDNRIIALGGGTPCYSDNMNFINGLSKVNSIFLKTSIPELVKRLETEKESRPLISHIDSKELLTEFIGKHIFERNIFYEQSKLKVETDSKSIGEIIESIILQLY